MGLIITKLLSECLMPECIDDCEITDNLTPAQSQSVELAIPRPPEFNIDLEAGIINGSFCKLTTSGTFIQEPMQSGLDAIATQDSAINFDIVNSDDDTNSTPSNPSDKTFDYGVIAVEQKKHNNNSNSDDSAHEASDDSLFDDVIIL